MLAPVELAVLVLAGLVVTGGSRLVAVGRGLGESLAELRHATDRRDHVVRENARDD